MITEQQLIKIGTVAHRVSRVWPDVSPEDLRQELCTLWLESWNRWSEDPHPVCIRDYVEDPDEERGAKRIHRTLTNWATNWCRQETAAIRGNDDYQQYTRYALRQMLPQLDNPEAWGSLAVTGAGGKSAKPAREGGDALASYADLRRAFTMLSVEQQLLLELRYVDEYPDWCERVVDLYDCTESAAAKRVSRALDALERVLAGRPLRDGPLDRRVVLTNAGAQSQLHNTYEG